MDFLSAITKTSPADSFAIDSFGNKRVSSTGQRFDVEFTLGKQPLLMCEKITGTSTIVHNTTTRDVDISINSSTNGHAAIFRQNWHNPYTPGNSQKIDITGTFDAGAIGGGTASVFIRNNGSDTVYNQNTWNKNQVSDVVWSKSQIFQIDFQSLKVGRIRFSMVRNGIPIDVHHIYNDNARAAGYWQYPNLPITWNIRNTATNTICEIGYFNENNGIGFRYTFASVQSAAVMKAICATVKSEGGQPIFDIYGFDFAADMGVTAKTISTTLIPIISIRAKSTFNALENNALTIPTGFDVQTNNAIRLAVLLNPTLTGASWVSADANSSTEYDVTASALTGGILINSSYISSNTKNSISKEKGLLGRSLLSLKPDSTQSVLTIAAIRTDSFDASVLASINWKELR